MPTAEAHPAEQFDDIAQQRHANALGMWLFLATELLLFGGLFAGFLIYRMVHPAVFAEAADHLDLLLGALNTAILLTSGLTMAVAELAIKAQRRGATLALLLATLGLGVVFLGIKGYEWHHEYTEQLMPVHGLAFVYPGPQPDIAELFFNFYYAMTGLHAAHMAIGLGVLATLAVVVIRWRNPHRIERQIQIGGLYWAFVDVIWVVVFTLLYLLRQ